MYITNGTLFNTEQYNNANASQMNKRRDAYESEKNRQKEMEKKRLQFAKEADEFVRSNDVHSVKRIHNAFLNPAQYLHIH